MRLHKGGQTVAALVPILPGCPARGTPWAGGVSDTPCDLRGHCSSELWQVRGHGEWHWGISVGSCVVNTFTTSREEVEKKSISYILRLCLLPFTTLLLPVRSIELRKTTTTSSPSCIVTLQRCSPSVVGWLGARAPQLGSLLPLNRLGWDQS